jgi:hypothetical protein
MKRNPALHKLSREHQHGLVAARWLRRATRGELSLADATSRFLDVWRGEIQPHFDAEEEILLPAFAQAVPPDHELIVRTLTEHVAIRSAVHVLERANDAAWQPLALEIGRALEDHIRFEERILFPAIESALAGPRLSELGEALSAAPPVPIPRGGCPSQ